MLCASAALTAIVAAPAAAQDAAKAEPVAATTAVSSSGLEEIVVTARRREENLQNTPISITALSADRLAAQGISSIQRIQDITPNLTFRNVPSNSLVADNAAIYIRGIGSNEFSPTIDPAVGMYLDGVYLRPVGSVFDLIDVERVEVLKGPQGTLFGRNTIGGAINITTVQPSDKFQLKADVKYGTDDRINGRIMVVAPITDNLFVKVAGGIFSQDGYVKQFYFPGKKTGNQDLKSLRAALRWLPTSSLDLTIAGDWSKTKSNGPPVVVTGGSAGPGSFLAANDAINGGFIPPTGVTGPCTPATCWGTGEQFFSKDTAFSNRETSSSIETYSVTGTAKWQIGPNTTLKSITAYRNVSGRFSGDDDFTSLDVSYLLDIYKQKQFTQELQLFGDAFDDKLNYQVGLFYSKEKGQEVNPIDFILIKAQSGGFYNYHSLAAYAQLTYKFTEKLSLTAGLRYTQDRKNYLPDQYVVSSPVPPILDLPPGTRIVPFETVKENVNKATPLVTLQYQWTPDVMTYATFSQGFRSGGFTQRIFPPEASLPSFGPEKVNVYEAGLKSELFDRMLRVNLAGYYTDYKDLQLGVADITRVGPYFTNAGDAHIQGFEAEFNLAPGAGVHMNFSAGMADAKFDRLDINVSGLTLDSKFVFVSKWTLSGSIDKTIELGSMGTLTPRADWSYRSGTFTNANGINTPTLYQPGYSLFDASVNYVTADGHYSLQFGVDNIGDKKYRLSGNYQPSFGYQLESFDRGRQWYMKAGVSF